MKIILPFFILLANPFLALSQTSVTDGSYEYYYQPEIKESYTVFFSRIIEENGKKIVEKERPKIRCEYQNGLLTKEIEYSGEFDSFRSFVYGVSKYSYKDTNLIKLEISKSSYGIPEVYYYTYDKAGRLIKSIGYSGKKLIWKETISFKGDTIFTKRMVNYPMIAYNQNEWKFSSKDGMEEFSMTEDENHPAEYLKKQFDSRHQIVSEVDSSADDLDRHIYSYDSLGRISEEQWMGNDSILRFIKSYNYLPGETNVSSFTISKNGGKKGYSELHTLFYDDKDQLTREKHTDYDKPLGVVMLQGEHKKEIESETVEMTAGKVFEKFYKKGRLQKTIVRHGPEMQLIYRIQYDKTN